MMHGQNHSFVSFGNDTLDKFLGGGLLNGSLNIFERQGPSSKPLSDVWTKSLSASTIASEDSLIIVNFSHWKPMDRAKFLSELPQPRKVNSEILYKDVRGKSQISKIKIAWRYSSRNSSPSDDNLKTNQIDFGLPLTPNDDFDLRFIDVSGNFNISEFLNNLDSTVNDLKQKNKPINIIIIDMLHPLSPLIDKTQQLLKLTYAFRVIARSLSRGAILLSYDIDTCPDHDKIKQHLYHFADSVVSFYSYETGQNKLAGYKNFDGTLDYVKVPKINSFGLHFQQELSDWGYRFTRNHRFFVVDELSLPPCQDDEDDPSKPKKRNATDITKIEPNSGPLEHVGPLEDFREIAGDVLAKQL